MQRWPIEVALCWYVVLSATVAPDDPCHVDQYYQGVTLSTSDAGALREALHARISQPHTVIPYTGDTVDVWDALKALDRDSENHDEVDLLYRQTSMAASMAAIPAGWNREHIWPKSYGVGYFGSDTSDVHNLRPADWNVNSARGNLFFDMCTDGSCSSPAHSEAAADTAKDGERFMPPAAVRGDIARSLFYMAIRYDGTEPDTENLTLTDCPVAAMHAFGKLRTLLQWHADDPVSDAERARNTKVCTDYQHNRNPFVDHPGLVGRLFAVGVADPAAQGSCSSASTSAAPAETLECSLGAGDAAIVGFNGQDPDSVAVVLLADLSPGAQLRITDNAWTGSGWRDTEGVVGFTAGPEGVRRGAVLTWEAGGDAWPVISRAPRLRSGGETLLLYEACGSAPNFLFGVSPNGLGWAAAGESLNAATSCAPEALVSAGLALVLPENGNYVYEGPTVGNKADLLAQLVNVYVWIGSSARMALPSGAFEVSPDESAPTEVPTTEEPVAATREADAETSTEQFASSQETPALTFANGTAHAGVPSLIAICLLLAVACLSLRQMERQHHRSLGSGLDAAPMLPSR